MDNNEIRKQMLLDQQRAFCKQSCTKIDQGLDRLDPSAKVIIPSHIYNNFCQRFVSKLWILTN